jgi:uncharacterized protein YvpB
MSGASKSSFWLKLLATIICLGLVGNIFFFLLLSGNLSSLGGFFVYSAPTPTLALIGLDQLSATLTTPTPFQPLPTNTPTPTVTPTATATATNTPRPTKTSPPPTAVIPVFHPSVDGIPESAQISGIYGYNQSHLLSCESRSAVDWANYFGVSINENTFLYDLPASDNPDAGFVGSADGAEGQIPPNDYGVHADPVANLLNEYNLNAEAVHGLSYDDLRKQIAAGHPVIVWVYGNVWSGGSAVNYTAADGNTTKVVAYEHTVIVIGYDSYYVMILDGGMVYPRAISVFKNSWATLGNMAVIMQ